MFAPSTNPPVEKVLETLAYSLPPKPMAEKLGEKAVCRTGVSARGEMVGSVPEEMEGGDFLMGVMLSPTSASTCTQRREEGGGGKREREREKKGKG